MHRQTTYFSNRDLSLHARDWNWTSVLQICGSQNSSALTTKLITTNFDLLLTVCADHSVLCRYVLAAPHERVWKARRAMSYISIDTIALRSQHVVRFDLLYRS